MLSGAGTFQAAGARHELSAGASEGAACLGLHGNSINRKRSGASAVLGGTVPRFPLGLALLHQWNKNGTWDMFTVTELASEKLVCLPRCV